LRGGVNIRHTNFFRAESKKKTKNLRKLMIWKIDFLLFQVFQEEFHIVVDP
jgi:hypothetical protein